MIHQPVVYGFFLTLPFQIYKLAVRKRSSNWAVFERKKNVEVLQLLWRRRILGNPGVQHASIRNQSTLCHRGNLTLDVIVCIVVVVQKPCHLPNFDILWYLDVITEDVPRQNGNLYNKASNYHSILTELCFFFYFSMKTSHPYALFLFTMLLYFMLSGRISRNIGENIFRSYTGTTSENTDFSVLLA